MALEFTATADVGKQPTRRSARLLAPVHPKARKRNGAPSRSTAAATTTASAACIRTSTPVRTGTAALGTVIGEGIEPDDVHRISRRRRFRHFEQRRDDVGRVALLDQLFCVDELRLGRRTFRESGMHLSTGQFDERLLDLVGCRNRLP